MHGATKLALAAIVIAVFAFFATVEANLLSYKANRDYVRQKNTQIAAQAHELAAQRHVLFELCRVGGVIDGLVRSTVVLFQADLAHAALAAQVRPVYAQTLRTFVGYEQLLAQQTACEQVKQP